MSCGPLIFSTLYELDGTNGSYVFNGNEHIFTFDISNSITFTVLNCDTGFDEYKTNILIVGGGGSGGEKSSFGYSGGGGGGGGQVIYNTDITINPNTPYDVIIGSGGAPVGGSNTGNSTPGNDGGTSSMFGYVANGGKGGGYAPPTDLSGGIGGNGGSGSGYTGKGGDGGNSLNTNCNYSGNFGSLVNGVYYGGGGGGGSYLSQSSCGNEVDTVGNCYGRGGYGGEGGGGNGGSAMPVACRTITPISASSSNNGTPNSGGGGAGQNGNPDVSNFSGAGGSGLVILYIYGPSHGCHWNPALANLTTVWSRGTGNCVDLSGATLPDGNPMTYDDLSEKRKAVIFQYKNNNAGFSKKQNFSRLARGIGKQRGNTFATQSQTYTNPNTLNLTQVGSTLQCSSGRRNWALTNQNDTPGPVRRITNYPTVPLTNYNVRRTYLAGGTKWPQYGPNNG